MIFNESSFPAYSCWKCYQSLQTSHKLEKVDCLLKGAYVPGLEINGNKSCEIFDYRSQLINERVQRSLSNSFRYDLWRRCCEDALDCCDTLKKEFQVENFGTCEGFWDEDERTCYNQIEPDEPVYRDCPYMESKAYLSRCQCEFKMISIYCKLTNFPPTNRSIIEKMPRQ